jgi:arylsulfatase A-like enzyme
MAAFLLLGKWFDFLKENGVYDNTRIIIVSDHGRNVVTHLEDGVILPNGEMLEMYQALLLVKDFDAPPLSAQSVSPGELPVDRTFMTNADVPVLATRGLIPSAKNPFTGKIFQSEKADGITLTTNFLWNIEQHFKNMYNIKPGEWLYVREDIFKPENWSQATQARK